MRTTRRLAHLLLLALLLALPACQKKDDGGKASDVDYYTCTMHPSVHSKDPGKCPICSMDLVPVMKKDSGGSMNTMPEMTGSSADAKPSEFVVPVERQQQIGVTYATVERKALHRTVRAVGMIQPDASRSWQFVARVDGYVQKLYVTSPGEIVDKGAPLMSIYSPDVLTSERELAQLLRMRDKKASHDAGETPAKLIEAAESRLRQWNVTEDQIAALEKSRMPNENLTLLSPFRGIIQSVPVAQGKNVKTGDLLAEVADLSDVWLWAEFYEDEISVVKPGQPVAITTKAYPGEEFAGQIGLINPFVDELKRTSKVRIDIPNPDFQLRPGMYANVYLGVDAGEGLTIPVNAIMPTGDRNVAFVGKGDGRLEPRLVELGGKFNDFYEVKAGLSEGERVVSSANFLIDAESKVQGALKDFQEPRLEKPEGKQ